MANTLKFGNGQWATGNGTALAYNDENANFKPLPFDFTRASSGTTVNQSGLIETVGSGIPRIDFQGNTKGALLLEPSRTNLITYSDDFSQSAWTKSGTSVVGGFASPSADAPLGAYKLVESTANSAHTIKSNTASVTSGATTTKSIIVKPNGRRWIVLLDIYKPSSRAWFDLELGVVGSLQSSAISSNIEKLSNGYFRCSVTSAVNSTPSQLRMDIVTDNNITTGYQGDGVSGVYIFGAQLEQGNYPTSYIPTSGSAVTRVQDVSKIVNSPILQATNQFTLFFDAKDFVNYGGFGNIMITLGTGEGPYDTGTGIHIFSKVWYYFNGTSAVTLGTCYNALTDNKFAISYDGTKFTRYANGVKLGTNTVSASMSNWDTLTNGLLSYSNVDRVFNIADLKLYNTALTDAQAIALTQ